MIKLYSIYNKIMKCYILSNIKKIKCYLKLPVRSLAPGLNKS